MKQLLFIAIAGAVLVGNQLVHAGGAGCGEAAKAGESCEAKDETAKTEPDARKPAEGQPAGDKEKAPKAGDKPVS